MTSKRANAVNRAIAEARGWTDIYKEEWFENYSNLFGTSPGAVRPMPLPDCYYSLDEAIAAAGELLPGKWHVGMHPDYSDGFVFFWQYGPREEDNIESIHATLDTVPAAICEAIVTARGLVVESEVSDGKQ